MGEALEAWLENHASREDAHSHQGLQTAKLVTTFAAAIAATFVATSLAEGPEPSGWDEGAVVAMALSVVGVLVIVFRARKAPDVKSILHNPPVEGRSDDQTIAALRREVRDAAEDNKIQTDRLHWIMFAQVVASMGACVLAVVSIHSSYSP
ncbi:hypothetical protein [Mycobacterium sp. AZCC_0083]|uniref:hypothetical protein n=1 Tax=Mycobacterium sp. AZCC_0083 TaxID=2735882 RepID=UPI0016166006|nr:hypothetical protein [Mycobacterium sp. AZCC_0083]MBB5161298.1 Na+/melibiose symporter-like transporter [Mycobacterium sp. AZCC_0083]